MSRKSVDLVPETVDLSLYAGDGVVLRVIVKDEAGQVLDVSGEHLAQIRTDRGQETPDATFVVEADDAVDGILVLRLAGSDTAELINGSEKFSGVWDVQWTPPDDEPKTVVQGSVTCVADVSR